MGVRLLQATAISCQFFLLTTLFGSAGEGSELQAKAHLTCVVGVIFDICVFYFNFAVC